MAPVSKSKPLALAFSLLISYLITGILLLLLSFLLYKLKLSRGQIQAGIYGIYALSCLAGGFFTGKKLKTRRFLWGALSGLLYFTVLLLLSLLIQKSIGAGIPQIVISFLLCAAGGTLGGMFS